MLHLYKSLHMEAMNLPICVSLLLLFAFVRPSLSTANLCISESYAGQCDDDDDPACSQSCREDKRSGGKCGAFRSTRVCYCDGCSGASVAVTRRKPSTTPGVSTENPLLEQVQRLTAAQPKPYFPSSKVISLEACAALKTDYCGKLSGKYLNTCAPNTALFTYCNSSAGDLETKYFLLKVGCLRAGRALYVELWGKRRFNREMFDPVDDILVALGITKFPNLSVSLFASASIKLTLLQHLSFTKCQGIVIQRDDFLPFPSLRMLTFEEGSTIASIEENAFDSLIYLRHITFEQDFDTSSDPSSGLRAHLNLLHCNTEYKWLRDWLQLRLYLLTPKNGSEVFQVVGMGNNPILAGTVFIPVDCGTSKLIATNSDGPFLSLMEQ